MEKEFIPYEQALALKELGFDEPCFSIWSGIDEINFSVTDTVRLYSSKFKINSTQSATFYINDFKSQSRRVAAPTFSQAFRWFRERYNIYVEISFNQKYENSKFGYIIRSKSSCFHTRDFPYKTYDEAELECLKKLIEIVKNGK